MVASLRRDRGDQQNGPPKGSTDQAGQSNGDDGLHYLASGYIANKLIAGRQLCSVGHHIGAAGSLKMRFSVMANTALCGCIQRIGPRGRRRATIEFDRSARNPCVFSNYRMHLIAMVGMLYGRPD